jgi:Mn-dependent DtxR family transcriptional regulator
MTTAQHLVQRIRRKQLLVCAHRRNDDEEQPVTLESLTDLLAIDSGECEALVRRLQSRGLIALIEAEERREIRLTSRGQRFLDRMARPASVGA